MVAEYLCPGVALCGSEIVPDVGPNEILGNAVAVAVVVEKAERKLGERVALLGSLETPFPVAGTVRVPQSPVGGALIK